MSSDRCPRCGHRVYFAEEQRALGKLWHKLCFKCATCNKLLDSTTCTEHDGEAFCKACYGKLFGPKGYGFAGGASGLSANTDYVTQEPTSFAQAQAAPMLQRTDSSTRWGGTDACPRCGKPVYFAEEVRAIQRKWHKLCLRCANCDKLLDSYTVTEHEGDAFCKACYGKKFGPKGYGFAGGASGLSMDTGVPYEISTDNVSYLAQAQAAPILEASNSTGGEFGGGEGCSRCGKAVYFAEEARALGKKWHKLCLRCANCNKGLDSTTCTDHEGEVYCKSCHSKLFGPKGYGYAGGAALLSMDTGRVGEITRENVSQFAQAQAAPLLENGRGSGSKFGADICPRCFKAVYFAEQVQGGGRVYHKACFKCMACGKSIDSTTLCQREEEIFCKACYGRNFGPKGFGYGQALQHTE